jgi:nucleoside-diphosphate-sugar epimerase
VDDVADALAKCVDADGVVGETFNLAAESVVTPREYVAALGEALEALDAGIDRQKRPARDPGPLSGLGPPQRQLRALLWKHGVKEYKEPGLNSVELVEKLEGKLAEEGVLREGPGE